MKITVNSIPTINFSERIKQLLVKDMTTTVVMKLLGRSLAYNTLHNRIFNLWKPSLWFHLMDVENIYFLVKFQGREDHVKVLTQGPWVVFGQCLTVQPWTSKFNPNQPFPSTVLAWIRLLGLLGVFTNVDY